MSESSHDLSSEELPFELTTAGTSHLGAGQGVLKSSSSSSEPDEDPIIEDPSTSEKELPKWAKFLLFLKGQKIRQFFFNPSTWMVPTLALFGISLLIQAVNLDLFLAEAAVPLFIMQTVFASIAGLMLVGAVLSLAYYGIAKFAWEKTKNSNGAYAYNSPESAIFNYLRAFKAWCGKRPEIAIPVIAFGVVGVLTLLVLTIGFFTGGFGLSPEMFSFMGPVFDFIGSGFTSGIQGASALPGLGALGSISAATMQLIGQVAAVFMLFAAAIFVPDALRRMLQTRWPEKAAPSLESLVTYYYSEQNDGSKLVEHPFTNDATSYTNSVYQRGVQTDLRPALFRVIVKCNYPAEQKGDLSISEGEYLDILENSQNPGWWTARNDRGVVGSISSNCVIVHDSPPKEKVGCFG